MKIQEKQSRVAQAIQAKAKARHTPCLFALYFYVALIAAVGLIGDCHGDQIEPHSGG